MTMSVVWAHPIPPLLRRESPNVLPIGRCHPSDLRLGFRLSESRHEPNSIASGTVRRVKESEERSFVAEICQSLLVRKGVSTILTLRWSLTEVRRRVLRFSSWEAKVRPRVSMYSAWNTRSSGGASKLSHSCRTRYRSSAYIPYLSLKIKNEHRFYRFSLHDLRGQSGGR